MELDELKVQLNQKFNAEQQKSSEDLALLLKKKTSSLIAKIRRSIWIELIACVAFTVAFALIAVFAPYWSLKVYFGFFSFVCVAFFIVLRYLLKKTSDFRTSALPVKANLVALFSILKEYVKRYFQLTMILIPLCLIFSFFLGYYEPKSSSLNVAANTGSFPPIIFSTVYIAALVVGVYYFTKWYLKKLYGNYLIQLEELIKELEESDF